MTSAFAVAAPQFNFQSSKPVEYADIVPAVQAVMTSLKPILLRYNVTAVVAPVDVNVLDSRYQYDMSGGSATLLVKTNFTVTGAENDEKKSYVFQCLTETRKISDVWTVLEGDNTCQVFTGVP